MAPQVVQTAVARYRIISLSSDAFTPRMAQSGQKEIRDCISSALRAYQVISLFFLSEHMRAHYIPAAFEMPVISRRGTAPNFEYVDEHGRRITSAAVLRYAASLVVPPNYVDVKIYFGVRASQVCAPVKLTYTGTDDRGRTQYGYSAAWKARANKEKFRSLIEFGGVLPQMRLAVAKLLRTPAAQNQPLNVVIALIVRIMNICHFRLGHAKYKDLYKSYGISTIEVRHLRFKENTAAVAFIGKKGVKNTCTIDDATVIGHLYALIANKGPRDFVFTHGDGIPIKGSDVNGWMRQFGVDASSKMFRTYATNVMLIEQLSAAERATVSESVTQRKRNIIAALDTISGEIHNTRAICKKEYVYPALIELYLNHPRKFAARFIGPVQAEPAFLAYLRETLITSPARSEK